MMNNQPIRAWNAKGKEIEVHSAGGIATTEEPMSAIQWIVTYDFAPPDWQDVKREQSMQGFVNDFYHRHAVPSLFKRARFWWRVLNWLRRIIR
jgi:hypothetical protein